MNYPFLNTICVVVVFITLITSQTAYTAPCEVKSVAQNAHLFKSASQMLVTPNHRWLLVIDESANNIKIIETATQQVLTTLNLSPDIEPAGLALSKDGTTLYISGAIKGNIAVANITAPNPKQWKIKTIWKIAGDFGTMLFNPQTSNLLVTDRRIKGVRLLSSSDGSSVATLKTEYCRLPSDFVLQDSQLFVACETSNKIAVFDLKTKKHRRSINVGKAPVALLLHPTLPQLYVANLRSSSISIINTENLKLIKLKLADSKKILHSPKDLIWLKSTIWILDQSAAALIALNPRTEKFKTGICTIANRPTYLATLRQAYKKNKKDIIYAANSDGVDYMSIKINKVRLQPQVLMAGFDPILLDLKDRQFSVLAIVEEGMAAMDSVSIEQNTGGLESMMRLVGSIPLVVEENRQIQGLVYEAKFKIPRGAGAFPEGSVASKVMGLPVLSLFGDKKQQFKIRARDKAGQEHSYPNWKYGNWALNEKQSLGTATTLENYSKQGLRRGKPQVIMAGLAPMLMDFADTELKVLAIVRRGSVEIKNVAMKTTASSFATAMSKIMDLPNGDELYQGTVMTQRRGQRLFAAKYEFSKLWNNMFQIVVTDKAQQRHRFPDFRVGNYNEVKSEK